MRPTSRAAKTWYSWVLCIEPYFDEPFYVGFSVGGYELGLNPDPEARLKGLGGGVAYWGVADAEDAYRRLLALGAKAISPVADVGGDIKVAVCRGSLRQRRRYHREPALPGRQLTAASRNRGRILPPFLVVGLSSRRPACRRPRRPCRRRLR
jgi:hypothetical protein